MLAKTLPPVHVNSNSNDTGIPSVVGLSSCKREQFIAHNRSNSSNSNSSTAVRTFASRDFHTQQEIIPIEKTRKDNKNAASDTSTSTSSLPPLASPHKPSSSCYNCATLDDGHNRHSTYTANNNNNNKSGLIKRSPSKVGLDEMDQSRRSYGDFHDIIVHMELYGKPIESVYDGVHDGVLLGTGVTGEVRQVTHRATGAQYAVKCLDLSLIQTQEGLTQLKQEIRIMCKLDHPHIVRLEEVYESDAEIYLIQELCQGGDLFDRLDDQTDGIYTEDRCASLVRQMLSSLRYLHSKGIIHRDIKLENFLFSEASANSNLHMIDFGLAKHFVSGQRHDEAKGTPYTVAPEVISGDYDEKCDVWAIGVLAYLLLSGNTPFGGDGGPERLSEVRRNILTCNYSFLEDEVWDDVSPEAKNFVQTLLVLDPEKRPNPIQCQNHPWLKQQRSCYSTTNSNNGIANKITKQRINPNVVKSLIEFKEFSTMQRVLSEVLSYTLLPGQIADLKEEFLKIDVDGTGEISFEDLKRVLQEGASAGSLGFLSEKHVRQIFDSLRIHNTDARIHWHEFIAAELKLCQVDERNMRRAFDRLDYDHKGYITLVNFKDLMGNSTINHREEWERVWEDSIQLAKCKNPTQITFDEFLCLVQSANQPSQNNNSKNVTTTSPSLVSSSSPSSKQKSSSSSTHNHKNQSTATINTSTTRKPKKRHHMFSLKGLKAKLHIPGPPLHFPSPSGSNSSKSTKSGSKL
eukprot:CAMPEP_0197828738 /NCGR_PEP_ID=MMETSP1437-20131217/5272_1 /TAXON_ID=49252 ORGANISM="Eucampia antarctica, Strain CCMP1452" /NCGR_SAMPLE_ID=MMETSP1437 /ASSEMBLY_ACC=CAM_ASM_001096 /LENGTH=741 /DNA_ID=CAMNT_0043430089 /DNA_START=359 /DNA_END=2584 /DNA_ORIENTATION=-